MDHKRDLMASCLYIDDNAKGKISDNLMLMQFMK